MSTPSIPNEPASNGGLVRVERLAHELLAEHVGTHYGLDLEQLAAAVFLELRKANRHAEATAVATSRLAGLGARLEALAPLALVKARQAIARNKHLRNIVEG